MEGSSFRWLAALPHLPTSGPLTGLQGHVQPQHEGEEREQGTDRNRVGSM
jgi:hypothetical protein